MSLMDNDYDFDNLICPECDHEGTKSTRCHECGGGGCFDTSDEDYLLEGTRYEICEECKGTGILRWCEACDTNLTGRTDLIDPEENQYLL